MPTHRSSDSDSKARGSTVAADVDPIPGPLRADLPSCESVPATADAPSADDLLALLLEKRSFNFAAGPWGDPSLEPEFPQLQVRVRSDTCGPATPREDADAGWPALPTEPHSRYFPAWPPAPCDGNEPQRADATAEDARADDDLLLALLSKNRSYDFSVFKPSDPIHSLGLLDLPDLQEFPGLQVRVSARDTPEGET